METAQTLAILKPSPQGNRLDVTVPDCGEPFPPSRASKGAVAGRQKARSQAPEREGGGQDESTAVR